MHGVVVLTNYGQSIPNKCADFTTEQTMRNPLQIIPFPSLPSYLRWLTLFSLFGLGIGWLYFVPTAPAALRLSAMPPMQSPTADLIQGPAVVAMDSPPFQYSAGWQVTAAGADPTEPADPWQEPSGTLTFRYQGADLALALAMGNYWGYLYVTVDGEPANQLPHLAGNRNSQGELAGYRTFYVPEAQHPDGPTPQWVLIHRDDEATGTHVVTIEVWRSWGQWPLRGVAVDAWPAHGWPRWPGIVMLLCAGWGVAITSRHYYYSTRITNKAVADWHKQLATLLRPSVALHLAPWVMLLGLTMIAIAIWRDLWPLTLVGLLLLLWSGLQRPALWIAAFLLGLPFYFSYPLPLLPGRALGIVDVGVLGGTVVAVGHWLFSSPPVRTQHTSANISNNTGPSTAIIGIFIALLASWALVCALEAVQSTVALREWRTVFAYGALFALTLQLALRNPNNRRCVLGFTDQDLLIGGWLLGSTIVAIIALWHYASDTLLIQAEGVQRVRAFYGSPNNLALYLERSLAVSFALAMFVRPLQRRRFWLIATLLQGAALLLTYSKGALLLALPTVFIVLFVGGILLLKRRQEGYRSLWWLVILGGTVGIALLPSLATERFQQLTNLDQGTGFIRLQLWRSSWQMALDHLWFGVGPDNFLYAYRSEYILPAAWQEPNLNHPHNWLLDWWTRLGLSGLGLALCWFGLLLWRQWRHFWQGTEPVLALGLFAATGAALAHGLIDASYALPDLMLIWVLMSFLSQAPLQTQRDA